MSALSSMCRTAILTMMLAALAAGEAGGAQASAAKTHRNTPAAASQSAHRPTVAHGAHPATTARAKSHQTTEAKASTAHRHTSQKAGRTTGQKARRQNAQRRVTRRGERLRIERVRAVNKTSARARRALAESRLDAEAASEPEPMETQPMDAAASPTYPAYDELAESTDTKPGPNGEAASGKSETDEASLHMPAPLRGSLASLERQNSRLDADGLERIEDESDLAARIANKLLVPVPASKALTVNPDLPENHRYCRPWTARFLKDLARAHDAAFHRPLEVSSAVRTVEYQKRLMRSNGNAAAAEGDIVSPHLTGATVDIAKSGLNRREIAWMRRRLGGLQAAGKIDVEEEFQQACFHITVYKSYAAARTARPGNTGKPGAGRQTAAPAEGQSAAEEL